MSKKFIVAVAVAALIGVVIVGVLPWYIRTHSTSSMNSCINNLRLIDSAKQQWALEEKKPTHDVPTWDDVRPFLPPDRQILICPHGGTYTLGRVGAMPTCSYQGDILE